MQQHLFRLHCLCPFKYINIKEIATEISQRTCEERKFYVLGTQGKTSSQDLMGFSIFRESLRLA